MNRSPFAKVILISDCEMEIAYLSRLHFGIQLLLDWQLLRLQYHPQSILDREVTLD